MIDFSSEIVISTARSGGSGGQNVNKVETMAVGHWLVRDSQYFTEEQKKRITEKLFGFINKNGYLVMKSSNHRSQLGNKKEVVEKMQRRVALSLAEQPERKATKVPAFILKKRKEQKQRLSEKKALRVQKPYR